MSIETTISSLAIVISSMVFLLLGFLASRKISLLRDFIPVSRGVGVRVVSRRQFSATSIAQTLSLATIIAAYFSLAGYLGLWLIWTAVTASAGMFLLYYFSPRIAKKLKEYESPPTLHEFLAREFSLEALQPFCASLTVVGLLLLVATELLVGGRFLSALIDVSWQVPITIGIALVVLCYVLAGGFRTVVISDQIQMLIIWLMIPAIAAAILLSSGATYSTLSEKLMSATAFPINNGVPYWFLVGIFMMNVPTHLSSMPMWQRIAACDSNSTLRPGLFRSGIGVLASWGLLVLVAWVAATMFGGNSGVETFQALMRFSTSSPFSVVLRLLIMLGLISALLSTAATLMIAISHTFTTDIFSRSRVTSNDQLIVSRAVLAVATVLSGSVVVVFEKFGYRIEDIIFSIYGGALSLSPAIVLALVLPRERLARFGRVAIASVGIGFFTGWSVAILGKIYNVQNVIFMSPAIGMVAATAAITFGLVRSRAAGVK